MFIYEEKLLNTIGTILFIVFYKEKINTILEENEKNFHTI